MQKFLNSVFQFIRHFWKTLLLIIIVSFTTLLLSAAVSIWLSHFHNLQFPSFGTIRVIGVEVYGGNISTMQDGTQFIDWGTVYPGTLTNSSFYIQSKSNLPVSLSLKQSNFTLLNSRGENVTIYLPIPATETLNITWNCSNVVLNPRQEIFAVLTLNVSSNSSFIGFLVNYEVVEFSFDIHIEAKPIE